jgi:hypothetical protein
MLIIAVAYCCGLLRWLDGMAGYRAGDPSGKLQGSHSLSRITDRCNGCARWTVLAVAQLGNALQDPGPYASEVGSDAGKFPSLFNHDHFLRFPHC